MLTIMVPTIDLTTTDFSIWRASPVIVVERPWLYAVYRLEVDSDLSLLLSRVVQGGTPAKIGWELGVASVFWQRPWLFRR